jgi:hypothetical protein
MNISDFLGFGELSINGHKVQVNVTHVTKNIDFYGTSFELKCETSGEPVESVTVSKCESAGGQAGGVGAPDSCSWYDYEQQKVIALPPVGVEVEFKYKIDKSWWLKRRTCIVMGFHNGKAWLHLDAYESSSIYDASRFEFRPLDWQTHAKELERKRKRDELRQIFHHYNKEMNADLANDILLWAERNK